MARLLLVSNRLPVGLKQGAVSPTVGGLATGLNRPHQQSGGLWIGWPGDVTGLDAAARRRVDEELAALRMVPVYLDAKQVQDYYEGFSNRILWPLFHYQIDHIPLQAMEWEAYRDVNRLFAEEVVRHHRDGDTIWVHDYQLCLVPGMVRERIPGARIGFFLHIPFPSSEIVQALPWRQELLQGLLGADLIGLHTHSYVRHFANALVRLVGLDCDADRVTWQGRMVRLAAFPMGVDAAHFSSLAADPAVRARAAALREETRGKRLLLGVDRLDYTKGIRRRMIALGRLLERNPAWREQVTLLQIAVPSRTAVAEYDEFRRDVDEVVGRINGEHATTTWSPIRYLYRGFAVEELVAFYCAADVMLVTPVRDGMNLVAKEFVAARTDERGVLVLSELAGAAAELGQALLVNPYDVDGMGAAFEAALVMPEAEQQKRMHALRQRVCTADVHAWVRAFLDELGGPAPVVLGGGEGVTPEPEVARLADRVRGASARLLLLDCDGTLIPFVSHPDLVQADDELKRLLTELTRLPATSVHIVSGRTHQSLEALFGELPLSLHGEHGLWSRSAPGEAWRPATSLVPHWKARARVLLDSFAERTPGALVEEKSGSIAWHYRMSDVRYGRRQANELALLLRETFSNAPVSILAGDHVIEVRQQGVHKGTIVDRLRGQQRPGTLMVGMGDDTTDEDLFAALPEGAVAIHVGERASRAPIRLRDAAAARRFLAALVRR